MGCYPEHIWEGIPHQVKKRHGVKRLGLGVDNRGSPKFPRRENLLAFGSPDTGPDPESEGFLLVVLMLSVLLTVMSLLMARHPASGVFDPISESEASN